MAQRRAAALLRQQLRMRAVFGDDAAVQHQDAVGVHHGVEPVRDHQQRAALREARQGVLDRDFIAGVGGGRGLVQHQHGRIQQHGAGDAHALAFAARQQGVFADHGVVASGSARMRSWMLAVRARPRSAPGWPRPAQRDVVAHAGVDQAHVLQHEADATVQRRAVELPQVGAAQRCAGGSAQQQPRQRGLPRPTGRRRR